jgi:hypothetical protein
MVEVSWVVVLIDGRAHLSESLYGYHEANIWERHTTILVILSEANSK